MSIKHRKFAVGALALAAVIGGLAPVAQAGDGSCAQPVSAGSDPVATDCLFILRAAVGTSSCDNPCICQPKGTAPIRATDALICLQFSVGQPVTIDCPCGSPDVESSEYTFDPDTAIADPNIAARFEKTRYLGAFSQDQDASVGDWTQDWTVKLHGNNKVWAPAEGGTLNGAVPVADGNCPAGTTDIGDKNMPSPYAGSMDVCELQGDYTTDGQTVTLTNNNIYRVNKTRAGGTLFGNGHVDDVVAPSITPPMGYTNPIDTHLVVEQGTLILAGTGEALIITRGSDIQVNGTVEDPVVIDSEVAYDAWVAGNDNAGVQGQWSGLVMTGFGIVNRCADGTSCDQLAEGLDTAIKYGSPSASGITNWDCGDIQYLVIDNPGFDLGGGNDTNGLTVYGCDYPTTLSHIQVNNCLDDGMEFFGGSAVGDHFVSTNNKDDNFDTDFGYVGGIQFGLVKQDTIDGDKGFEADNGLSSDLVYQTATPLSKPNYANITVLNNTSVTTAAGGLSLRTETGMNMWNVIQTNGKNYGIRSENLTATNQGADISFDNVWLYDPAAVETATNGILRGTDATDKTNLTVLFDAGANNVRSAVLDPGLNSVGYPNQ